jgi:replicative DNA helicase
MNAPEAKVTSVFGRTPPNNEDLERAVLSAALNNSDKRAELMIEIPSDEAFYQDAHQRIWAALRDMTSKSEAVDIVTLAARLKREGRLESVGGISCLSSLIDGTPSVANAIAHAKAVVSLFRQRRVLEAAQAILADGFSTDAPPDEWVNNALTTFSKSAESTGDHGLVWIGDAADRYVRDAQAKWTGEAPNDRLRSGIRAYDELTGGLRLGHLHVLAGLTSSGKSAFALQLAEMVAGQEIGGEIAGALYVSGEMLSDEIAGRAVCRVAELSDDQIQAGRPAEWDDFVGRLERSINSSQVRGPVMFHERSCTVHDVRGLLVKSDAFFRQGTNAESRPVKTRLVVIDYLQIMKLPKADTRDESIATFTRELKQIALETRTHIVLLSQFGRAGAQADEPEMSHLFGSSSIENDANVVTILARPCEKYDKDTDDYRELATCTKVKVEKNRGGRKGATFVSFVGEHYSFREPTEDDLRRWRSVSERNGNRKARK